MPKSLLNKNLQLSAKIVDLIKNKTIQPQLLNNEMKKIVGENTTEKVESPQTNKFFFEYISNTNNLKNLQQTINVSLNSNNFKNNELKKIIQNEIETSGNSLKIDFNHPFSDEKAIAAYFSLKPIITVLSKLEGYSFPNYASFKLAALLGSKEDALAYLDNFSKRNNPKPTLHSALEFGLPKFENKKNNISEHRAYITENLVRGKFKPKFLKLLGEPKDYNNSFNRFNEFTKNNRDKTKKHKRNWTKQKAKSIYAHLIELLNIIKKEQTNDKILSQKIKNTLNSIPGNILKENHKKRLEEYLNNKEHLKTIISELNVADLEPNKQLALKKKIENEINSDKPESSEVYSDSLDEQGINSYLALKPLARLLDVIEESNYPLYFTYKLSVLFNSAKQGVAFLESFGKQYNGHTPLHDATLFNLPNIDSKFDLNKLRDMSSKILRKRYVHEYVDLIGNMHKIFAINDELKGTFATNNGSKILYHKYVKSLNVAKNKKHNKTSTEKFLLAIDNQVETNLKKRNKKSNQENNNSSNKEVIKQTLVKKYIVNINQIDVLLLYARTLSYGRAQENIKAATILSKMKVPENHFNAYLDFIKETPPQSSDTLLPFCYIRGSFLGKEYQDYYIIKINANDPKAAFLGHPTGCCQSIGSQGEECAKYGVSQENSGFYVLCKGAPPKISKPSVDTAQLISAKNIVAQTWAWRTFDSKNNKYSNTVVFDNIECSDNMEKSFKKKEIVRNMFQLLAKKLCESSNSNVPIESVHIGQSMGLGHVGYKKAPFSNSLINKDKTEYTDYSDYIDCKPNMVVYDIKEPHLAVVLENTNSLLGQIKQNKFSPIQISFLLKKAKKFFNQKEFNSFFQSVIKMLPSLIKSGQDLADILYWLPKQRQKEIYNMFKNKLLSMVKTGNDLSALLEVLDVKEKNKLLDLLHNKPKTMRFTPNSVVKMFSVLDLSGSPYSRLVFNDIEMVQYDSGDSLENSIYENSLDVTFNEEENKKFYRHSSNIYELLYNDLPIYIEKAQDLISILRNLNCNRRIDVLKMFKNKLPSMLTTIGELSSLLECLKDKSQLELLSLFKDKLPSMIKTIGELSSLFGCLSREGQLGLFSQFKNKFPSMINSPEDISCLVNLLYLHRSHAPIPLFFGNFKQKSSHNKMEDLVYKTVQNCFHHIIKKENDLIELMNGLSDSKGQERIYQLNKKVFGNINTLDNLIEILCSVQSRFKGQLRRQTASPEADIEDDEFKLREWLLMDNINKLPSLINSMEDLKRIINLNVTGLGDRLVGPQRQILHDALKHKFKEILNNSDKQYSMKDIKKLFPRIYGYQFLFLRNNSSFKPTMLIVNENEETEIINISNVDSLSSTCSLQDFEVLDENLETMENQEDEEKHDGVNNTING